ncbi:MAG: hypothetical protein C4589_10985 [Peptococcaceae bacterium]|nr:MAG: hypothetical protein C4589_10985 [Peptococcaceae bacterium]
MPKMYSHNKLANPSAETGDLAGWTSTGVTVVDGGIDGSKCFQLANAASMYQEVLFTAQPPDFRLGVDFKSSGSSTAIKAMLKVEYFYSDGSKDTFIFPFRADVPSTSDLGDGWKRILTECEVRQGITLQKVRVTASTNDFTGGVYLDAFILKENLLPSEETEYEPPAEEVEEKENPPTDSYGINDEYLDFYPNKCYNSSFEVFDPVTLKPSYWNTSGVVSPDSEFDNTYSLKLTAGQYAEQKEEAGIGFVDPDWWSWCPDTRFAFMVKGSGQVKVTVLQGGSAVLLWVWRQIDGKWQKVNSTSPHSLTFDAAFDWHEGEKTFAATPVPGGGKIKLRFDMISGSDVYIDAVVTRPDWIGRWPGLYKHGPRSVDTYTKSRTGGRNIWVQSTEPTAFETGDLWVVTA